MPRTPSERIVLFPEPLREKQSGRRYAAVVLLCGALAVAGWFLIGDSAVRRVTQPKTAVALARDTSAEAIVQRAAAASPKAQAEASTVDSGVDAYDAAFYDTAAILLRRALRARGVDSLDELQRVRALTFLGAAELLRGHRDSSTAAFRRLLVVNPNRPPDHGIFPPEVISFYDGLRSRQQGVARIASTPSGVALTVVALAPHQISVGIGQNGQPASFQLFHGIVRDSVVVTWTGMTPQGAPMQPGKYEFVLIAMPSNGTPPRSVRFPVVLERERLTGALHARAPGAPVLVDRSGGDAGQLLP